MDDVVPTPALVMLNSLIGTWRGEGSVELPAVAPAPFTEEIRFSRRSATSLDYYQRARDPIDGSMLHSESGIWRTSKTGAIEVTVALPGAAEVSEGSIERRTIMLSSSWVGRAATAAGLVHVDRRYQVDGDSLAYDISIVTLTVVAPAHVRGTLHRIKRAEPGQS